MRPLLTRASLALLALSCAPLLAAPAPAPAPSSDGLSPMHGIHEWVAGYGSGDADGPFDQARFGRLAGLVYDPSGDRLLVADQGLGTLRTIALARSNQVGTLGKGDGFAWGGLRLVSPTALAWIQPGVLLAVLDPGRPGLSVLDLSPTGGVAQDLTPPAGPAGDALRSLLAHGTDLIAVPGGLLLSASTSPELALFALTPTAAPRLRRTWTVAGLKDGPGLDAVSTDGGRVFTLRHGNPGSRAYALLSGTDDGFARSFQGPDSGLPVSLSAQELTPTAAAPWAFVKGGRPFDVVTRSPYLASDLDAGLGWKLGVYDRHDRLLGVEDNQLFDKWGKSVHTDPDQPAREWCAAASYACADPSTDTWYISEPSDGRILSFRPIEDGDRYYRDGNLPGFAEWDYPLKRRPEVTRLAVMNLSLLMLAPDTQRHSDSFSKRLEHWMNAFSALDGSSRGYEVCFIGAPYSYEPDGLSCLGQLRAKWTAVEQEVAPNRLILLLGPLDPYETFLDFRSRPVLPGGLPALTFDPEFAVDPDPSKLDPEYRAICDHIKRNKGYGGNFSFGPTGKLVGSSLNTCATVFNQDPFLFQHSHALLRRYMDDLEKKALTGGPQGRPLAITVLYYPDFSGISAEEGGPAVAEGPMREALREDCRELGWDFVDITGALRVLAADDPFLIAYNFHPTAEGQDELAFITAWKLLRPGLTADGPAGPALPPSSGHP